MNRMIVFFLFFSFTLDVLAQNEVDNYYEGIAYFNIFNEDLELVKEIPAGKNVLVEFDQFYNSYKVMVYTQDGVMIFDLRYSHTDDEGFKIYRKRNDKLTNSFYSIDDQLKSHGLLIILNEKIQELKEGRFIYSFTFKNLKVNPSSIK